MKLANQLAVRSSALQSCRRFSSAKVITRQDVEIVKNPSSDLIKSYCKKVTKRKNFTKPEDLELLKKTMGSNYHLYLMCLKDSHKVVGAGHMVKYKSLIGENDFQNWSVFCRQNDTRLSQLGADLLSEMASDLKPTFINSGGCVEPRNVATWNRNLYTNVRAATYYRSVYRGKDISRPIGGMNPITVKNVADSTLPEMIAYDNAVFPFERSAYMTELFKSGVGKIAYDDNGKVVGIGCLNNHNNGNYTIGPLYCDSTQSAQAIFDSMLGDVKPKQIKRLQVISSGHMPDSATWIRPFLRCSPRMSLHYYVKFNRVVPAGLDYNKVLVSSSPLAAPL